MRRVRAGARAGQEPPLRLPGQRGRDAPLLPLRPGPRQPRRLALRSHVLRDLPLRVLADAQGTLPYRREDAARKGRQAFIRAGVQAPRQVERGLPK